MTAVEARACRPTILDPVRADPLCDASPLQEAETPHLLAYLAAITDPRRSAGRRHRLVAILAVAAAAVLAGARSITTIAGWVADAPEVRAALGARRDPSPATGWSRPRPPSAAPLAGLTPKP